MENIPKRKYKKHKEGYTVSVVHHLRKDRNFLEKLLRKEVHENEDPRFPIYVRVNFLNQTTTMRSRLMEEVTENEFASYFLKPDVDKLVAYEIAAIKQAVKEFNPEENKGFAMTEWTSYYKYCNEPIRDAIAYEIAIRAMSEISMIPSVNDKLPSIISDHLFSLLGSYGGLRLMADLGLSVAQSYISRYKPVFDVDDLEIQKGNSNITFTIWDWRLGFYQSYIKKSYDNTLADSYLKVLDEIFTYYRPNEYLLFSHIRMK